MRILANRQIHPQAVDPIPADVDIEIPWSAKAKSNDTRVLLVQDYLSDFHVPAAMTEDQKRTFINYASGFFLLDNNLWKHDSEGEHKLVVPVDRRCRLLQITHDELRHKGVYSVRTHLLKRYWWPQLPDNIKWFMKTCHMCQSARQTSGIFHLLLHILLRYSPKSISTLSIFQNPMDSSTSYTPAAL